MQAVLKACQSGNLQASPKVLITNNRKAEALNRAKEYNLKSHIFNGITHPDPEDLDLTIYNALQEANCDLIVLAGYMKLIGPKVLNAYKGRIINIHPSLLPAHGGQGMYDMRVHKAVIESGDLTTGVSVHLVDEHYDTGRILDQTKIPVTSSDTPESLSAKVIKVEHEFLTQTLKKIVSGAIKI